MTQKTNYLLICFFLIAISNKAQNFNYSLTKDSSEYQNLSSTITLTANVSWTNKFFVIHSPFQINLLGEKYDSLVIESNGFLTVDRAKNLSIVAFTNFGARRDENQQYVSSINYQITGTVGNRIIKIEFKNLAMNRFSSNDQLEYQLWLYENNSSIEFHIGSNPYGQDSEYPFLLGLINRNMDTANNAFLISGNPSSPSGEIILADAELKYINTIPKSGIIYKLTPNF